MSKENGSKQALQSLTATIDRKISEGEQKNKESFPFACIYRVPEKLRKLKESAYTPGLVSIGPLHSKDKHLQSQMQGIKMSHVDSLLFRMTDGSKERKFAVLDECVEAMKLLVEDAKKCYTEEVDNLNEEMLVVDGCFILELLYRDYLLTHPKEETNEESNEIPNDPVFGSSLMSSIVLEDLLLLENQLPFFVLEKLFDITVDKIPCRQPKCLLFNYIVSYFRNMPISLKDTSSNILIEATSSNMPMSLEDTSSNILIEATSSNMPMRLGYNSITSNVTNCCLPSECVLSLFGNKMNSEKAPKKSKEMNSKNGGAAALNKSKKMYCHILHILHDHRLPLDSTEKKGDTKKMPSASYLDYAGVKFVAGTGQDLVKVKFTDGPSCHRRYFHRARFEIQTVNLYDSTEVFLRNLIAFEQCRPGVSFYFTSYAFLMDMLVNSEKDVEVLQKARIIQNYLGSEQEASDLFNNLCKEVVIQEFFFAEACNQATKYSERCWPASVAYLKRKYFASPWTFIAFCVAFIIFVISITQFIRSFL